MELRFSPLFSGSSGNAIYVGCDDAHILVDAGMSGNRVTGELMAMGVDPRRLNAILVTHEHADHIKGIGILSRKYDLPIYATEGTWQGMYNKIGLSARKIASYSSRNRISLSAPSTSRPSQRPTTPTSRWVTPLNCTVRSWPSPRTLAV